MLVFSWTTVALALWVLSWGLGFKAFDGLLFAGLIVVLAAGWSIFRPYLPGYRTDPEEPGSGRRWLTR